MQNLRDRPIRQKITFVIMMVAGVVLLLAFAALFCFQAYTLKQHCAHELAVVGEITAHNCAAAVMFKDEDAATQILGGIRTMPQIVSARLELVDHQQLAFFGAARDESEIKAARLKSGFRINGDRILLAQPVMLSGTREGTLYLLADLHAMTSQLLKLYGGVFALGLVASLLVAFVLSSQFLRFITDPILRLAGTARTIADHNDYSVRANKVCGDEVGVLTDAFNQMLAQIQSQDSALRKAEEKYRLIFEDAIEGMFQTTPDGKYLSVNPAMARMYGYGSPEELTASVSDIGRIVYVNPERRTEFKRLIEAQGFVERFEYEVYRKDGSRIWLSENAHAVRGADGGVLYEGTAQDITERKRAEEESRLMQTIALAVGGAKDLHSALGMVVHNVCEATGWCLGQAWIPRRDGSGLEYASSSCKHDARFEKFHAFSEGFTFLPGEGLPGRVWASKQLAWIRDVTVDTNFPRAQAAQKAGLKAAVGIPVMADEQVLAVIEFFVRESREEDERFVKLISSVAAQLGQIVQRKQAEEALRQAEQKYRLIFEDAIEGMFQTTPDGKYLSVNPAIARMFGYESPEELMASVSDIGPVVYVNPERRTDFKRLIEAQGFVERFEYEVYRKDGSRIWLSENARAVRDANGVVIFYEGAMQDMTERKRVDEVERASKAKSEFLSRMSHELRTPLNAILGFGQLLERQKPTEVQRTRISYILSAGRHLLELINEVLDISRIEAGHMQFSLEPVSVTDAVDEAIGLVLPLTTERKIKIERTDLIDSSPIVLADRQRLKQVLLNLLANAVKYNRDAGRVIVDLAPQPNEHFRISIIDEGPGIPSEKRSRLFSPFERLGAEAGLCEGTGLGLALSKRLVEAMAGTIGESAPASGSCFWIEFPQTKDVRREHGTERELTALLAGLNGQSKTLLYIEDNVSNLTLIEHLLSEYPPIKLISAMQGSLGLELAVRHQPDLILLDVHLPDLSGAEVLARLKANPRTSAIPVVVLSADATKSQIDRLMAAGANEYLTKPLEVDRFSKVVEAHLCETATANGTHS